MTAPMSSLEQALADWLPQQRWYGGKGRALTGVRVEHEERLDGGEDVRHTLLHVTDEDGGTELYQVLLGHRSGEVETRLERAVVGEVDGRTLYDAVHDPDAVGALLRLVAQNTKLSRLTFTSTGELDPSLPPRVMGAEQSNTSVVYGDGVHPQAVPPGAARRNPDLEITRALAEAGSPYVAQPLGWLEGLVGGETTTLGLLQVLPAQSTEGWAMATASVRDLFAEADLHADEVGGDFAGESERLGVATAEVHRADARVAAERHRRRRRVAAHGAAAARAPRRRDRDRP